VKLQIYGMNIGRTTAGNSKWHSL